MRERSIGEHQRQLLKLLASGKAVGAALANLDLLRIALDYEVGWIGCRQEAVVAADVARQQGDALEVRLLVDRKGDVQIRGTAIRRLREWPAAHQRHEYKQNLS
jgi:hypothetical protein